MAGYELKTKLNDASVEKFIKSVKDKKKQEDAFKLLDIFEKITGEKGKMWGSSIIGFGSYRYKYASGQEGDWMLTGFSPRKTNFSLYILGRNDKFRDLLNKLGKYKSAKSCLYVKSLDDIDLTILKSIIKESVSYMKKKHK